MMMRSIACLLLAFSLTGCMGHNGLTAKALKFNLTTTEDRWAREFMFVGMFVVLIYPICTILDLFIFNSIEFWSGENPINGKSPLVDIPMSEVHKMGMTQVVRAQVERVDEKLALLHLDFSDGDKVTFDVVRDDFTYTVSYLGVEYYHGKLKM
jgi:hypothetical protein